MNIYWDIGGGVNIIWPMATNSHVECPLNIFFQCQLKQMAEMEQRLSARFKVFHIH